MAGVRSTVTTRQLRQSGLDPSRFTVEALDRELAWRRWFPSVEGVDFTSNLDDETTERLFQGCVAFLEDNLFIRVPGQGKTPFRLRDAQKLVLRDWIRNRNTVALKARQIGFSTLVGAYCLWLTFGYPDRQVIMLSKTERESIKLLSKVKYNYRGMPEWVRERGPKVLDRTKQVMTFDNDSVIESLPSANDPARGESVFLIVVDEWAFLPNPEEAWASIEPVTDIGGRVIGISTAKGEGNFFHRLWLDSQTHVNNFHGIFFPWWAVESRDEAWYESKRRQMEPWQLHQEYPSNPDEAFVGSGNPVFDLENIRRFRPEGTETYTISAENRYRVDIVQAEDGPFHVWETPNDEDRWSYVIGCDPAQGEIHGDFTVATVICVQTNSVVAVWRGKMDPDVFGFEVLPAIGWYYRNAVICPEVNNHGLTVLKALQRSGYQRIYVRRTLTKRYERQMESLGWLTTMGNKGWLIDECAAFLRETPNVPYDVMIAELRSYVRDERNRMSGSPHDDCVMSLALAVQAKKYAIKERVDTAGDPSKIRGSFGWWTKQLEHKKKGAVRGIRPLV